MEFTKEEKEVLRKIVERELEDIKKDENLRDQPLTILAAEIKYDEFLERLKKKLA